jgi:hypothetical protein
VQVGQASTFYLAGADPDLAGDLLRVTNTFFGEALSQLWFLAPLHLKTTESWACAHASLL